MMTWTHTLIVCILCACVLIYFEVKRILWNRYCDRKIDESNKFFDTLVDDLRRQDENSNP